VTGEIRKWLGLGLILLAYLVAFQLLTNYRLSGVILLILYFLFGALIGFDHVIRESRKEGKWQVDRVRLLGLGVSLVPLVAVGILLVSATAVAAISESYGLHVSFYTEQIGLEELSTILLGYLITSSIRKASTVRGS